MPRSIFLFLTPAFLLATSFLPAEIRGKLDVGPAYVHVDVLESGKTVKAMHMGALKVDATLLLYRGTGVKAGGLAATGQGDLASYYVAGCQYLPLNDRFSLLPSVGVSFSYLRTTIHQEHLLLFHLKERFRSVTPYVALEFSYKINEKWYLSGMYQYGWARSHTKIRTTKKTGTPFGKQVIFTDHSHSCGPNYSLGVDYTLNEKWSVNFGGAYSLTLSKEKHGLRGYGFKLGASYYF